MRRSASLHIVFAYVLLALMLSACRSDHAVDRPNILFIFSDDQRADAVGAYDNPNIQTPALDRLSRFGFNFREAHIMGSHHGAVCAPSRAMLMSGRSLYNVYDNLDSVATFPELLREGGYVTFGTGKWHQSRESFARSFSDGRNIFFGGMSDHASVPVQDLLKDGQFSEVERKGFSTDLFADAAIDFFERYVTADTKTPFFAYVSFTAPHDPRTPPPEYLAEYSADQIPLPPNFLPLHPFHNGWMTGRDEKLAAWPRSPDVIRNQISEYYGLITHLDARIGDILNILDSHGLSDRTIVVFSSDNGLALGSHGLLGKQSLYEHSNRVPLIVSGPGIPAGESGALVLLHDLFPTIAELTGVDTPVGVEGRSLAGIWRGDVFGVRDAIYTVYEDLQRSVRDDRWKLIRYPKIDHLQLFDLLSDPFELQNLADDPAHSAQLSRLVTLMESLRVEMNDPHPLSVDSTVSMEFDYASINRTPDRHQPEWVIDKYFGRAVNQRP